MELGTKHGITVQHEPHTSSVFIIDKGQTFIPPKSQSNSRRTICVSPPLQMCGLRDVPQTELLSHHDTRGSFSFGLKPLIKGCLSFTTYPEMMRLLMIYRSVEAYLVLILTIFK